MIFELLRDYLDALAALPANHPKREAITLFYQVVHANTFCLKDAPWLLYQQLFNHCDWEHTAEAEIIRRGTLRGLQPWLRRNNRPPTNVAVKLPHILTGHRGPVTAVAISPD